MKYTITLILIIGILLVSACEQQGPLTIGDDQSIGQKVSTGSGEYTNISVSELQTMLENKDFTFVNVHVPFEGNISQTDLSIPFDQIASNLDKLPEDKDAKIVLYCRSDNMSNTAAKTLANLGYTNVWNLVGGFNAWENAGLPLESEP